VPREAHGGEAAAEDAERPADQVGREPRRGERHVHAVERHHRRNAEALDGDERDAQHHEVAEDHEHRKLQERARAGRALPRAHRRGLQLVALRREQQRDQRPDRRRAEQRRAPVEGGGHRDAVGRRRGEAEIAGDAVPAEGVAEPVLADARVENGEVHRVEHAVADAAHHGGHEQHGVAVGEARERGAGDGERKAREEHAARAEAVHGEAGERLAHARDRVVQADRRAERRVGHAEVVLDERKEHRGGDLEEVRQAVRERHQPDHLHVAPQRVSRRSHR
jgi:hypothetical protein